MAAICAHLWRQAYFKAVHTLRVTLEPGRVKVTLHWLIVGVTSPGWAVQSCGICLSVCCEWLQLLYSLCCVLQMSPLQGIIYLKQLLIPAESLDRGKCIHELQL